MFSFRRNASGHSLLTMSARTYCGQSAHSQ